MPEKTIFLEESADNQFRNWQKENVDGFYLNVKSKKDSMIHKADCWHLGVNEKLNAATNLKICSGNFEKLKSYSEQNHANYKICLHCIK